VARVPDHAGFAAAITIRAGVLADAMLSAYAAGSFPSSLPLTLDGPPVVDLSPTFLGPPQVQCLDGILRLTLPVWGPLSVAGLSPDRVVSGAIDIDLQPLFQVDYDDSASPKVNRLELDPLSDLSISRLELTVVDSNPFPPEVQAYLSGTGFTEPVQARLRFAGTFGLVSLPSIDISFLGDLPGAIARHEASTKIVPGAVLVGLGLSRDGVVLTGDLDQLSDFAGDHDIVAVTNPAALTFSLPSVKALIATKFQAAGATPTSFSVSAEPGKLRVRAEAQESSAVTLSLSFAAVPVMAHTEPGLFLQFADPQILVRAKTWAALEFAVEDPTFDIDRAWWVYLLEGLGALLMGVAGIGGLAVLYIELTISGLSDMYRGQVGAEPNRSQGARVQRRAIGDTGAVLRIEVSDYSIDPDEGTLVGIRLSLRPARVRLAGPTTIPSDYADQLLGFRINLPLGVLVDDPQLRLRWSVTDATTNALLAIEDGTAAGRLVYAFIPADVAPAHTALSVRAEMYRDLGLASTALVDESVPLRIRGPLPSPAYVRWSYGVVTPQLQFQAAANSWDYSGNLQHNRRSAIHRTDQPCQFAGRRSRYTSDVENFSALPFALQLLEDHRGELCDYCFYGGAAGVLARL
jgi:hypothetical protein